MIRWIIIAAILWIAPASANTIIPLTGLGNSGVVTTAASVCVSYTGPGDVVSGAVAWYGLRGYNCAYATGSKAAVNIVRASDSHACDLLITTAGALGNTANCSTGGDNGQSGSSFCTSTTCSVTEMYDQSGASACSGACPLLQATGADQPILSFSSCTGGGVTPCINKSSTSYFLQSSATFASSYSQPNVSQSFVQSSSGFLASVAIMATAHHGDAEFFNACSSASICMFAGATLTGSSGFTGGKMAAQNALYNAASSTLNIDGTVNTGNPSTGGITSSNTILIWNDVGGAGSVANDLSMWEGGYWNAGFSAANETALCQNQQTFYGSGNFGATC